MYMCHMMSFWPSVLFFSLLYAPCFLLYILFPPHEQRGGGVYLPSLVDHEQDWPLGRVVFLGLATNTLKIRNNNTSHLSN